MSTATAPLRDSSDVLIQFDENAFESVNAYQEDFEDQVNVAQEQLAELRAKQEQLENQKRELEELQERKREFTEGRGRLVEDLSHYVAMLEHEAGDAQKRAEKCLDMKDSFDHHLLVLKSLRPEQWSRLDLAEELGRAIDNIEEAEEELDAAQPFINSIKVGGQPTRAGGIFHRSKSGSAQVGSMSTPSAAAPQDFNYWFKSGLAFTLPLMIVGGIVGLLMMLFGGA